MLGHRGARHAAPENTFAAFELAREEGADGIELDVRLDGSGRVIVLHDPTLERVTKGEDTRHSEDIPGSELERLNVGNGEHVPLLSEVLIWAKEHHLRVNVELKSDVRRRVALLKRVAAVVLNGPKPLILFSSFHPFFVWWLSKNVPNIPRAWLVHDKQRVLKYAPGSHILGANGVNPEHVLASAKRVAQLKRTGCLVNVWTVNDPARARELAKNGVDSIISDTPGEILLALG